MDRLTTGVALATLPPPDALWALGFLVLALAVYELVTAAVSGPDAG